MAQVLGWKVYPSYWGHWLGAFHSRLWRSCHPWSSMARAWVGWRCAPFWMHVFATSSLCFPFVLISFWIPIHRNAVCLSHCQCIYPVPFSSSLSTPKPLKDSTEIIEWFWRMVDALYFLLHTLMVILLDKRFLFTNFLRMINALLVCDFSTHRSRQKGWIWSIPPIRTNPHLSSICGQACRVGSCIPLFLHWWGHFVQHLSISPLSMQ